MTESSSRKKRMNLAMAPVSICFPIPPALPTSWVLSTSTKVLVEHLLYARGLIPVTVMELNRQYENDVLNKSSIRRKVSQCRSSLASWNREWSAVDDRLFDSCSLVLLSLGPSFSRTREFYLLNAEKLSSPNTMDAPKLPSPHALARRLLPRVVEHDLLLPSRVAASYQIWVSIYVKQEALEHLWTCKNETTTNWVQRASFQPPTEKTMKANERLVEISMTNTGNHGIGSPRTIAKGCKGSWISVPTSIKGFRI